MLPTVEPGAAPQRSLAIFDQLGLWADNASRPVALLSSDHEAFSFSELNSAIDSIADSLRESGIASNDIVAVAIPNGIELLIAMLGVARACAACPLDYALTETQFQSRLSLLRPSGLITTSGEQSREGMVARSLGIPQFQLHSAAKTEKRFCERIAPDPVGIPSCRQAPDGTAVVLETSGASGAPKLVPLLHRNVCAMIDSLHRAFELTAEDRFLSIMPLHHLLGLICALAQLLKGGSVVVAGDFEASRFGASLETFRPTWFTAGPTQHRAILHAAEACPERFRGNSLRFARCGSAAIEPAVLDSLQSILGAPIVNGYGLTEAGPVAQTAMHSRKPGSVGRSVGPSIAIMDGAGSLLPPNSEGEVILSGDCVMPGYLDDPAANRESFRDGWFRTGDLGWMDDEGDLFITGRIKESINRGGETIAPLEIDAALTAHTAVHEAAVFAIPHPTLGEDLAAAVVLREGTKVSEAEFRHFLASRVSRTRMPNRFVFVDAIPRTVTGKPRRRSLSETYGDQYRSQGLPEGTADEPSTPLQERIAEIWHRVLKKHPSGPHENFFSAGGDSLALTVLLTALEKELPVSSEIWQETELFEDPTVAALARLASKCRISEVDAASGKNGIVLQKHGDAPPFFCFTAAGAGALYLRPLARFLGTDQPFVVLGQNGSDDTLSIPEFQDAVDHAVASITKFHPTGPCFLGGHCYGGVLAFETALRLVRLGRTVPLVVLFDTPTPGYPKPMRQWKAYLRHARRRLAVLRLADARKEVRDVVAHVRFLRSLSGRKSTAAAANQPVTIPSTAPPPPNPATSVMSSYAPQPFSGRIVHFLAADQPVSAEVLEDARLGWRDFAAGGFDVFRTAGRHDSLFSEEHAPQIALRLRNILRSQPV